MPNSGVPLYRHVAEQERVRRGNESRGLPTEAIHSTHTPRGLYREPFFGSMGPRATAGCSSEEQSAPGFAIGQEG